MDTDVLVLLFSTFYAPLRGEETVVGRSVYCSVIVRDGSVSRLHATIHQADGVVRVADLGSRNGTFVNGTRVSDTPVVVQEGDEIRFGDVACTLSASAASRETAATQHRRSDDTGLIDEITGTLASPEGDGRK